jgi:hypothetical protein
LLAACPNQELAAIKPCTIAAASIDAAQNGVDKVDVLFVIDNSGSMSEEQLKLSKELPRLVRVLASGDLDGVPNTNGQPDFTPVSSLHLGVVSSDLGVNGQLGVNGCGTSSFKANDQNVGSARSHGENKPHGDEGRLLSSTAVALAGVSIEVMGAASQAIAARAECASTNVPRFLTFEPGKSGVEEVSQQFGCIAELGVNGCGYEQQLESMWRALAPSSDTTFSTGSAGQGGPSGLNNGFLREDGVLVVIVVSDEEDCSSPDQSRDLLYAPSSSNNKDANVLCARHANALHPVSRYVDGLKSLKPPAYQDRIIFAGIVGVPTADQTANRTPDQILALPAMTVEEEDNGGGVMRLRAACIAGDAGRADPARRMVEVARSFGKNGVITSICEEDYGPALSAVIAKIADKLSGACLPRELKVNAKGLVDCTVVEIKAADDMTPCDLNLGRKGTLDPRLIDKRWHTVCEVAQLPVPARSVPAGLGWYYDNFSKDATERCKRDKQRIAFATGSPLSPNALARVECVQPVLEVRGSLGAEAVNAPCIDDGSGGAKGDAKCIGLSLPDQMLICVSGTCQLACQSDVPCGPGNVCGRDALGRGYCTNPTCPAGEAEAPPSTGATVPAGS